MANQLQTGTKKENQKKPAAIDRIEKRKKPSTTHQIYATPLCHASTKKKLAPPNR